MDKHKRSNEGIPSSLDDTIKDLQHLLHAFSDGGLNVIPFKDSWTAAQVIDHITQSNRSIIQALQLPGKVLDRKADERTPELRKIFLDFSHKLNAPDFILPTQVLYDRMEITTALDVSVLRLKQETQHSILSESIEHIAFGEITKLELLYFVVYHTQRHIHQLKHIFSIVEQKQYKMLSFLFMQPIFFF